MFLSVKAGKITPSPVGYPSASRTFTLDGSDPDPIGPGRGPQIRIETREDELVCVNFWFYGCIRTAVYVNSREVLPDDDGVFGGGSDGPSYRGFEARQIKAAIRRAFDAKHTVHLAVAELLLLLAVRFPAVAAVLPSFFPPGS